jgi:topoisomerase IA-like protein
MAEKAQSRASGLLENVREASHLERLEGVFDERVSRALHRLGVPTHDEAVAMNAKLDRILKLMGDKKKAKKKVAKKKAKKKQTKKTAGKKAASKKAGAGKKK